MGHDDRSCMLLDSRYDQCLGARHDGELAVYEANIRDLAKLSSALRDASMFSPFSADRGAWQVAHRF